MTEDKKRLRASREIGQALRAVQAIQMLYRITGGIGLTAAILAINAGTTTVGAVAAGASALLFIGAAQVREQPGPWSIGMATMISVMVGYMVIGSSYLGALDFWGIASAVALWCVLPLAFRAQKLMERYPDLYISEKWKGRRGAPTQTQRGKDVRAENRRQRKQSWIRMGAFVGGFVVFVVVLKFVTAEGGGSDEAQEAPPLPEFGSRAEDFRQAWNTGTWKDIEQFLPPAQRARRGPKVQRLMKKRGWDERRPKLLTPRIDRGSYFKATYHIEGFSSDIVFVIYWDVGETAWWWAKTRWPKTELVKR